MTQPVPFNRSADYSQDELGQVSGRSTIRTAALDDEFDDVESTIDQILTNLAILQRDDTKLQDGIVELHTLSPAVKALFTTAGATIRGDWITATAYALRDVVTQGTGTYIAATAHTSGVFATDLAADKWVLLYDSNAASVASVFGRTGAVVAVVGDYSASEVTNDSGVAGTNVDAALNTLATGLLARLQLAGGTMTGALELHKANDVAVGATTDIGAITGNSCGLTGTGATITALGTAPAGAIRTCLMLGASNIFVHNTSAIYLPYSRDLIALFGDTLEFLSLGAGVWYLKAMTPPAGRIGGAEVVLDRVTFSGVASVDWESVLDSTRFMGYQVHIEQLYPTTNAVDLLARIKLAGVYPAVGYASVIGYNTTAAAGTFGGVASTIGYLLATSASSTAANGFSGVLELHNPHSGTNYPGADVRGRYVGSGGGIVNVHGSGHYGSAGSIQGIRLVPASGNCAGIATLIGIRKQ